LSFRDPTSPSPVSATAQAPEYRFELPDLFPGSYTVELLSPASAYLRTAGEIAVTAGGSVRLEVELGLDPGRVTGAIKSPSSGGPQPHARVAVARSGGSPLEFHAVQSDQKGRFVLSDVHPGEYRIGAWLPSQVVNLAEPRTWQQAGRAVKTLLIEPNTEIELELTAAP
jgi:hypothetical protein